MSSSPRKGIPFFAVLLGLLFGAAGGLYYAWFVNPVSVTDISPNQLDEENLSGYVLLISEAYLIDQDVDRARARLRTVEATDASGLVAQLADDAFLSADDPQEVRALTILAEALGEAPEAAEVFSGTVVPTSVPLGTPTATFRPAGQETLTPTRTPRPTLAPITPTEPFIQSDLELVSREVSCNEDEDVGLIEVIVLDSNGEGLPGLPIRVSWEERDDVFYTGFKPEAGLGFADFEMEPELEYSVEIVSLTDAVSGINSTECTTDSDLLSIPSYQLIFAPDITVIETPEAEDEE